MLLHRWSHHPSLHPSIYAADDVQAATMIAASHAAAAGTAAGTAAGAGAGAGAGVRKLPPTASAAGGDALRVRTTHREGESLLTDPLAPHLAAPFATLLPPPVDHQGNPLDLDPDSAAWIPDQSWTHRPSAASTNDGAGGRRAGAGAAATGAPKFSLCVDGGAALWNKAYSADQSTVGLYKLNPGDPYLETAYFQQPLNLNL
jgi:hypothetical protein